MKIFDSHFHIINPEYPLVPNNDYLPPVFTVENYLARTSSLNITGGAVVSGSFQAFDQEFLIAALRRLGESFCGVANIPASISDAEIKRLQNEKVVAVRFNLRRGGSASVNDLERLSNRLFDGFGWHTELYVDSRDLKELKKILSGLRTFSIDHLGLSKEGLAEIFYWAEKGVKIKATGFGRLNFNPVPVLKKIYRINPDALMFGTDLPSTRAEPAFSEKDIILIKDSFSEEEQEKIFCTNALEWYKR